MKIPWDKYETAILVDMYWKIEEGTYDKKTGISVLSYMLRKRAKNNGVNIDDTFRNENGIALQLSSIEYIFTSGRKGLKKPPTKIYSSMCDLYINNRVEFDNVLFVALVSVRDFDNLELFELWLKNNNVKIAYSVILEYLEKVDQFCTSRKIIKDSIFDSLDSKVVISVQNQVKSNRFFRNYVRLVNRININDVENSINLYKNFILFVNETLENFTFEFSTTEPIVEGPKDEVVELEARDYSVVNFEPQEDYSFTTPFEIVIFDEKKSISNWKEVYVTVIRKLYSYYPNLIDSLKGTNIGSGKRMDFGSEEQYSLMVSPKEVAPLIYVETNLSANDIVKKISALYKVCDSDISQLVIKYKKQQKKSSIISETKETSGFRKWLEETNYSKPLIRSYCLVIDKIIEKIHASSEEVNKDTIICAAQSFGISGANDREVKSAVDKYIRFLSLQNKQSDNASPKIERDNSSVNTAQSEHENNPYKSVDLSDIEVVLHRHFTNGYRFKSLLAKRRFKNLYQQENGNDLSVEDSELENRIAYLCVIVDDMAYLTKDMMPEELKEKIFSYIQKNFDEGKKTIHFESIINEFNDELFETCICNNTSLLKAFFEKINDGKFYVFYGFVASDPNAKLDSYNEIKGALVESGIPLTFDELYAKLPHIQQSKIRTILASNEEFICNRSSEYFHAGIFHINENELSSISSFIANAIYNHGFLGGKELLDMIKNQHKDLIEENSLLTDIGIRDSLKYLLKDRYSFRGKIISSKDEKLDMKQIFASYCKTNGTFTLDDLNQIKADLGTVIYFDTVYQNSLRISKEQFVPRNSVEFPVEQIDEILEQFCQSDYIPLKDISTFGLFPYIEYPWNSFLLEHYVSDYSAKFKVLSAGHNANKVIGAIVKRVSDFEEFIQVLSDALANSDVELIEKNALEFFVESGYLARKSYSNIDIVLEKAKKIRNQR